jgi:hypothetical protein
MGASALASRFAAAEQIACHVSQGSGHNHLPGRRELHTACRLIGNLDVTDRSSANSTTSAAPSNRFPILSARSGSQPIADSGDRNDSAAARMDWFSVHAFSGCSGDEMITELQNR